MDVFENNRKLDDMYKDSVLVIGNFDGVHLGHQELVKSAREIANRNTQKLGVLTFDPHPNVFFNPEAPPFQITSKNQKQAIFADIGLDFLIFEEFNTKISQLSPKDFVQNILHNKYAIQRCVVGSDFRFGHKKSGSIDDLKRLCALCDIDATVVDLKLKSDTEKYGSTYIRDLIKKGNFDQVAISLGRPWVVEAPVIRGDQRGRELGYPTANQKISDYVQPPYGIYAVRVRLGVTDKWHGGVANFGIRPMFEIDTPLLETFIFDFDRDIYDQVLTVEPVAFIRGEANFDSLDALVAQMDQDTAEAKAILNKTYDMQFKSLNMGAKTETQIKTLETQNNG